MSTYGEMQTRIATEVVRDNINNEIKAAIQSAIKFYENTRFWFNEVTGTALTTYNQNRLPVPVNLIEFDTLKIRSNGYDDPITKRDWSYLDQLTSTNPGIPTDYAIYRDEIYLYPSPDGTYTLTMAYVKSLPTLALETDTNAWMTDAEILIRSKAKYNLFTNLIRDYESAAVMRGEEKDALNNLLSLTARKISSGRLRPTQF